MPNLIAHFGVQGPLSRLAWRRLDLGWILLGCVVSDVPWILQRAVRILEPAIDPYDLRLYVIAQASLVGSLPLCAAAAALSSRPRIVFPVLAVNCALHLALDALQTKWATGVHLLAPLSWSPFAFGLFWPESAVTVAMVLSGCVLVLLGWRRCDPPMLTLRGAPRTRLLAVAAALALYVLLPLGFQEAVEAQDNHFVKTLREERSRIGRPIEFDREDYEFRDGQGFIRTFAGEWLRAEGRRPRAPGTVSARGAFIGPRSIRVEEIREHSPWLRDSGSYLGLAVLAAYLARGRLRRSARHGGRD